MADTDDRVTRTMAIPAWMVYGAMMLISLLAGGPVGQLVMLSHHVYENHSNQAKHNIETAQKISNLERDVAMQGQKQDDILHAVKSLGTDLQELNKTVAVLTSRMP